MRVIFCKLVGLEVYNKERGGGKKSRKYANVIYVRPLFSHGPQFSGKAPSVKFDCVV